MLTSSPSIEFLELPDNLLDDRETEEPWHSSENELEGPSRLAHLRHVQHLTIKVPHLRKVHGIMATSSRTRTTPWPCQNVFCGWLWAAVRPLASYIEEVEFEVRPSHVMTKDISNQLLISS